MFTKSAVNVVSISEIQFAVFQREEGVEVEHFSIVACSSHHPHGGGTRGIICMGYPPTECPLTGRYNERVNTVGGFSKNIVVRRSGLLIVFFAGGKDRLFFIQIGNEDVCVKSHAVTYRHSARIFRTCRSKSRRCLRSRIIPAALRKLAGSFLRRAASWRIIFATHGAPFVFVVWLMVIPV